ncbi:alpha-amylase [Psychromonas hadalis]|uniref:alpha-amylase n=1 Tax=Psychromonas hadalis TaxID=211669 RepID=UPI00041EBBD5|nr:alpha-amylase [Psychromonas hadalis]
MPLDTDGDFISNVTDSDDDNDGVTDTDDAFPLDKNESLDTDGDGTGNNTDAFPLDRFEQFDSDNDGWGDFASSDDDGDGIPDSLDFSPLGDLVPVAQYTEAFIYYKRADANYTDWGVHLWNNESCSAVDTDTRWDTPYIVTEDAGEHGVLFRISLKENHSDCLNFVIHKGEDRALGADDQRVALRRGNRVYTFDGNSTLNYKAVTNAPLLVAEHDVKAHWLTFDTLAWSDSSGADHYELWANSNDVSDLNQAHEFEPISLTETGTVDNPLYPHLTGRTQYSLAIDRGKAKEFLKKQLIAVALDAENNVVGATRVQFPFAVDDLYTKADNDADEAVLGAQLVDGRTQFNLWAPTAQKVELYLYDANKVPLAQSPVMMTEDSLTGIWSHHGEASLLGSFYRYRLQVFHPKTNKIEWVMTTDPYSVSLSTNSRYSQLVDLNDAITKPAGWDAQTIPTIGEPEDNIIYELHVRDFSGSDTQGTPAYNGKYLAFTEAERSSVKHLLALKEAGLTTIHLLPTFDISSVNEDPAKRIDLEDDISKLCDAETGLKPEAAICAQASSGTLQSILETLEPTSSDAQTLMADIRPLDGFNWGYDPYHYSAPEGSYADQSDGISRIVEYREMIKTLHEMGFRVVQDVVYNHMSSSALYNSSVLDKVVPGYYHRRNPDNGYVESSTCCDNTASEHRMFEKLVTDSLVFWAKEYKIDGFRFDLMGHLMKSSIEKALVEVKKVDPDNWFYGEGWDFGEVAGNARGVNGTSWNMAGTGVGTYNDRMRDAVRGAGGDTMNTAQGFANAGDGNVDKIDLIRLGMTGNLQEYPLPTISGATVLGRDYDFGGHGAGYAADPQEAVNYVSKHDNQTLWDIIQYKAAYDTSPEDRARMQILGLAPVMLGQGVPFLHMGTELLRSKSMERDSYDSGDWYNRVDFSMQSNNWNVGLPREDKDGQNWATIKGIIANANTIASAENIRWTNERFKEFLAIRSQSKLLRLGTSQEIIDRVTFHNVGTAEINTIVMSIDDGVEMGSDLDPNYQAIIVAINASTSDKWVSIPGASSFVLHPVMVAGDDPRLTAARVDIATGKLVIPGLSVVVFVKPQQGDVQGTGMDAPVAPLYLRGEFNDWGTEHLFEYKGQGIYELDLTLEALETVNFKLASSNWANTYSGDNLGKGTDDVTLNDWWGNADDSDGNSQFIVPVTGSYHFKLDLSNPSNALLTIVPPAGDLGTPPPFNVETLYLRGTLTDWSSGLQMRYIGDGKYNTNVYLRSGEYQFKLASADWTPVWTYDNLSASAGGLALQNASYDAQITITVTATEQYSFELDAVNDTLSITSDGTGSTVNETMMQYFHWYNTAEDNLWSMVSSKAQNLADVGITALWLPPAYKAMAITDGSGKLDVGYSTYDLYDLGEFDQQGQTRTKYGDKTQYLTAISAAHDVGIKIYADIVLNHKMGAEATEQVTAVRVEAGDRNAEYGSDVEIAAWTKFDFPVRNNTYSPFKWNWQHFDGVDWNQTNSEKSIFKFRGKAWDTQVSSGSGNNGNYDYLMGADLDMGHPDVVAELKIWGKWYVEFAGLDGLRLDAVKHIDTGFFNTWLDSLRSSTSKELFTVGEYWDYDLALLQTYLSDTGYRMSLFDAPLHLNFHHASTQGGGYDMGSIMNNTLMKENPAHAVTLVENHDTQSLQSLESPVENWFKPLAYAFILLRQEGYPNVFYADYYGANYTDTGTDGNYYTIDMPSNQTILDILLQARRDYAYGKQISYLDHSDVIGWTREGDSDHLQGMAVLMTDADAGTKLMAMGINNADECFVDITGNYADNDRVCTDEQGNATFKVKGGSVSVWVGGYVKPEQPLASNLDSFYFRGTPNGWGTTAMTLVSDHIWELVVNFTGAGDGDAQRFKFTEYNDWNTKWADWNGDGILNKNDDSNIYTDVIGNYLLRVNDQNMSYTITVAP